MIIYCGIKAANFFFAGQIPKCVFRVELGEKLIERGYENLYLIFSLHVLHQINSL